MQRIALLVVLAGCRGEDKHVLPVVTAKDPPVAPAPPTPPLDRSTLEGRLRELFGATQAGDPDEVIAKLVAQRATVPETERPLIDRTIALLELGKRALAEQDRGTARQLHVQVMRDTVALLEEMAASAPDDLGTVAMAASSLHVTAANIEAMGFAAELPPREIVRKARALADRIAKVHPGEARAWALVASVTPQDEPEARLRSLGRCVKADPAGKACQQDLEVERAHYVRPFCDRAELRDRRVEWREASRKPIAGGRTVEYRYETYHLAPRATYSLADVVRVRASEARSVTRDGNGQEKERVTPSVIFELAPAKVAEMIAWTRGLEARDDGYALLIDGELQYIENRAMWEASQPGVTNLTLVELCKSTQVRTLPPPD